MRADALKYVWQQLELSNQVQEEDNLEEQDQILDIDDSVLES